MVLYIILSIYSKSNKSPIFPFLSFLLILIFYTITYLLKFSIFNIIVLVSHPSSFHCHISKTYLNYDRTLSDNIGILQKTFGVHWCFFCGYFIRVFFHFSFKFFHSFFLSFVQLCFFFSCFLLSFFPFLVFLVFCLLIFYRYHSRRDTCQ